MNSLKMTLLYSRKDLKHIFHNFWKLFLFVSLFLSPLTLNLVAGQSSESQHHHQRNHGISSILREHHNSGGICTESSISSTDNHKVEKRSYLPPISCSSTHERGALKSKIHCQPRPRVIKLPWPNDTAVHQMTPSHIEVNRCDGGCFHHAQSCLPSKIQRKQVPVLLAQCSIQPGKCDKICATLEIEEHTECQCECEIKAKHCNEKQIYREELCSCQCRDLTEVQACHDSGRVWDPGMCMCRCPLSTLQECSTKFVFDFTNSCKCIPDPALHSNEIPGSERTERSHENTLPNWQILTVLGLVTGLFVLIVATISLVRQNHRLKVRLASRPSTL